MSRPPLTKGTVVYARYVVDNAEYPTPWGDRVRCVPLDHAGRRNDAEGYVILNAADLITPAQAKAAILATKT